MEQPCYKCGQAVEQGIPFCPHCTAPQIRVVIAEPEAGPAVFPENSESSEDAAILPVSQPGVVLPVRWAQILKPCALAALVATGLVGLGLNLFVAMIGVGFLAVVFSRQWRPGTVIKPTAGAGIGALGGLLWYALSSLMGTLIVAFLHKGAEVRSQLIERINQAASQTSDPQTLAVFERFKQPGGLELLIVLGFVFAFLAATVLGGLGGALGSFLGRRNKT
jgi:hypothetical protein